MVRPPPRSPRTDKLCPFPTLFRSRTSCPWSSAIRSSPRSTTEPNGQPCARPGLLPLPRSGANPALHEPTTNRSEQEPLMLTGDQYLTSLDDGRATFFEGEQIKDMPGHEVRDRKSVVSGKSG